MLQRFYEFCVSLSRFQKRSIMLSLDVFHAAFALFLAHLLITGDLPDAEKLQGLAPYALALGMVAAGLTIRFGLHLVKLNAYELPSVMNSLFVAISLGATGMAVATVLQDNLPFGVFPVLSMVFLILTVSSRIFLRSVLIWIYRQKNTRKKVLIYGAGQTGQQLAAALATDNEFQPVGFVDDNPAIQSLRVGSLVVYSPLAIPKLLSQRKVDRVILAMPSAGIPAQTRISVNLRALGCDVHVLPSFADLVRGRELSKQTIPLELSDFLGRRGLDEELPGVSEAYAGRNILVTGAGGSIGSEICRQLLHVGPSSLVLLDHSEAALYTIGREISNIAGQIKIVPVLGSICEASLVRQVIADNRIDVILHAAAYKHVPMVEANAVEGIRNNVLGTKTLADAAKDARVERFTLISTDKAVRPVGIMGCTKRLAEMIVQDLSLRSHHTLFSMVRFGNVLGSSGSVIPLFQEQIARGGPVTLTHGDVTRYFMTPSEAVRLVLLAGTFTRGGDVFVLDMGVPIPIQKVARQMIEGSGYTVRDQRNPNGDIEIIVTGLRPGEKMHEELLIGSDMLTTPHPKILRAREDHLSELEMANVLKSLRRAVDARDLEATTSLLRRWVEGDKLLDAASGET